MVRPAGAWRAGAPLRQAKRCPLVVLVTDLRSVPETELLARLERLVTLPPELRARVALQLRDPELPARQKLALGEKLRRRTAELGVMLLVNDRLDLALALGADGAHLGRRSVAVADARALLGERALLSVACHTPAEAVEAGRDGADVAILSPIFPSPGKPSPLGLQALSEARAALRGEFAALGLVALGGVTKTTAGSCLSAGAEGVAAVRADPAELALLLDASAAGPARR